MSTDHTVLCQIWQSRILGIQLLQNLVISPVTIRYDASTFSKNSKLRSLLKCNVNNLDALFLASNQVTSEQVDYLELGHSQAQNC
jgi:hypothetical protein